MPAPIDPAEVAAYATLQRAIVSIRLNMGRHLQHLGEISLVQFEILFFLAQSPAGLRMFEIADATGLSRSGLTYQITQMERSGWVRRTTAVENSRAVTAVLTDAGRTRVESLQERHLAFVRAHVFDLLRPEELATVTGVFQRIADGFDAGQG